MADKTPLETSAGTFVSTHLISPLLHAGPRPTRTDTASSSGSGANIGIVVAIAIGGLLVLLVLAFVTWRCVKRKESVDKGEELSQRGT